MAATLVVARGPWVFLVGPSPEPPRAFRARAAAGGPARPAADAVTELEPSLPTPRSALRYVGWGTEATRRRLSQWLGTEVRAGETSAWKGAVARLRPWEPLERRRYLLALARARLLATLRSPEEVLVSLAREEARVERAVEREARAAESFVAPTGTVLAEYARLWASVRDRLGAHLEQLRAELEHSARAVVPNLSAVVGPRVAARLVAAAGGVGVLARVSSSRLQLLGSRRRPSPERGPRYGLIYRAPLLDEVPPSRRAAFARSLASAAVVAARADATTGADVSPVLLPRLERRRRDLSRKVR